MINSFCFSFFLRQAKLQLAQDTSAKVLADWRKQKAETSAVQREMNEIRMEQSKKLFMASKGTQIGLVL